MTSLILQPLLSRDHHHVHSGHMAGADDTAADRSLGVFLVTDMINEGDDDMLIPACIDYTCITAYMS